MRYTLPSKMKIVCIIVFFLVLAVISLIISSYKALPRFHDVLGNLETIDKPLFFEAVFRFEDYPVILKEIQQTDPDRKINNEFAVRLYKGTHLICDPFTGKAYTPVPEYNLLDKPSLLRILPAGSMAEDFKGLHGLYRCTLFIRDDPQIKGLTKIITLYVTSCKKISWLDLYTPSRKIEQITPEPDYDAIRHWRALFRERYPSIAAPEIPVSAREVILFHSVPQGVSVYAVTSEQLESCRIEDTLDPFLLREKLINQDYFIGKTPFVLQYKSFFNRIILYEFTSISPEILDDGQLFESVERMEHNPQFYNIIRGYPVVAGRKDAKPIIQTALFQLKTLSPDDIRACIGDENSFPVDDDMFKVYIKPILRQARKEIIPANIDEEWCRTILSHAGKLNIETSVGHYCLQLHELTSFGYSVTPVARSNLIIKQDAETLYKLRDFIYRD